MSATTMSHVKTAVLAILATAAILAAALVAVPIGV
jgi:hypothetical protein